MNRLPELARHHSFFFFLYILCYFAITSALLSWFQNWTLLVADETFKDGQFVFTMLIKVESIAVRIFPAVTPYGVTVMVSCKTNASTVDDFRVCGIELCRLHQTRFKETDNKTAK
jgi:lipoate-protein ligase B